MAVQRSAYQSSLEALRQPTIRVVAIIAEGVPEADTKQLIAYARQHNKILIGPATVGGVQVLLTTLMASPQGEGLPLSPPCHRAAKAGRLASTRK